MSRTYFGTDGVRGKVGESPITPDFVMRLGYAAGRVLVQHAGARSAKGEHPAVLIGKDTRVSGYMLEAALEAGFAAAGVDVMLVGPMPTPAVAYLTRAVRAQAGVVISASHNPYDDNGIKFFSAGGLKLADAVEQAIEEELQRPMGCADSVNLGKARRLNDAAGRYIEFCKSTFPNDLDLRGMKIVVDCAHGAAYQIAPMVFHELGADVTAIGSAPNGRNINDGFGATHPQALVEAVRKHNADLGIALDGDADRLVMVDADGRSYDGDELLYLIVKERSGRGPVAGVAGTLMTNLAFEQAMKRLGIPFGRAKVGDRYVLEMLNEKGWQYGGENSGHILCLDCHTTGDGIISALQVLSALRKSGLSLKEAGSELVLYPQVLKNVRLADRNAWQSNKPLSASIESAEKRLAGRGRVLLRPSGTEPVLRVMVEGEDGALVNTLAEEIAAVAAA
ncbi:MAG: phosphoglucosamine mutase [Betaproteobacteria bacterium]|nr:phosphoglucosamine mutase [Betaproteobacteria bacterium]